MINYRQEILNNAIGFVIEGLHHDYLADVFTIILDNKTSLKFSECALVYDAGMIGSRVLIAKDYEGDMGFTIDFRQRNKNADDYFYCILKSEQGKLYYQNQIRIAYKSVTLVRV